MYKILILLISIMFIINSCSLDPLGPLEDPSVYSKTYSETWVLYDDVLNTLGGDVLYYPSDPGPETMKLTNVNDGSAYHGDYYYRLTWSGDRIWWEAEPPNNPEARYEHSFCGISLIVATKPAYYDFTPARDLSGGKYTKCTFYARGDLSDGVFVKFEAPGGAIINNIELSKTKWEKFEMDLIDLNNVKDYFKVTLYYPAGDDGPAGDGGYVEFDYVAYEK